MSYLYRFFSLIGGCWLFTITAIAQTAPTKHALIIAISQYDFNKTGWKPLASHNDVALIQSALQSQQFKAEHITVVENVNAQGIIDAILQFQSRLKKGDIAVIHYSGHGVQLQDDNGDEPDQLDEALVPLEAVYAPEALSTKQYLRDDTLGQLFLGIRQQLGSNGHLLLFLDSCHSGSGTRGNSAARGDLPPLVQADFKGNRSSSNPSADLTDAPSSRGQANSSDGLAKFISFAGASSNENNFETEINGMPVGSLSYAISKVFTQLKPEDTYRQVFAHIRAEMSILRSGSRQTPILEGDVDFRFFGGQLVKQAIYVEIKKRLETTVVELNGGIVAGINKGDVYALYPAGTLNTQDTTKRLTQGIVIDLDLFSAKVSLSQSLPPTFRPPQYWAFRTQQSFSGLSIKVAMNMKNLPPKHLQALEDSIQKWPFAELVSPNQADIWLKNTPNTSLCKAYLAATDVPFVNMAFIDMSNMVNIREIKKVLLSAAQVKLLKSTRLEPAEVVVEMSLVRARHNTITGVIEPISQNPVDTLTRRFSTEDTLVIKVTNKGRRSAYFNIIAIQPDNEIVDVAPRYKNGDDVNSYKIASGDTIYLNSNAITGFYPPYGTEMMKIFATPQPISLYPLIQSQGEIARTRSATQQESNNPIESLIDNYSTRGPNQSAPRNIGSTFEYVYTIIPDQPISKK